MKKIIVKNYEELYRAAKNVDTIPLITDGHWRIRDITVIAIGQSVIHAYDTAVVYAYGPAIVHIYEDAKAYACGQIIDHGKDYYWERNRINKQNDFIPNKYNFLFQFPEKEIPDNINITQDELIIILKEVKDTLIKTKMIKSKIYKIPTNLTITEWVTLLFEINDEKLKKKLGDFFLMYIGHDK